MDRVDRNALRLQAREKQQCRAPRYPICVQFRANGPKLCYAVIVLPVHPRESNHNRLKNRLDPTGRDLTRPVRNSLDSMSRSVAKYESLQLTVRPLTTHYVTRTQTPPARMHAIRTVRTAGRRTQKRRITVHSTHRPCHTAKTVSLLTRDLTARFAPFPARVREDLLLCRYHAMPITDYRPTFARNRPPYRRRTPTSGKKIKVDIGRHWGHWTTYVPLWRQLVKNSVPSRNGAGLLLFGHCKHP